MKNSEIRSLVDEAKADLAYCEEHINLLPMYDFKMTMRLTSAIETLLAREAAVMGVFGSSKPLPFCHNCDSYQTEWQDNECLCCGGNLDTSSLMLCEIRAILNPEENDK